MAVVAARAPRVKLGRFRIERELGAAIYAAYDTTREHPIALRILPRTDATPRLRAARVLAGTRHANLVAVHEVGRANERDFIAMELVDGFTLADWLHIARRSRRDILAAFVAAGTGLAAAHACGIVHGRFSPSHVMRARDGRIAVTDFGTAFGGTDDQLAFCAALWDALIRAGRIPHHVAAVLRRGLATDPAQRWPSLSALLAALVYAEQRPRRLAVGAAIFAVSVLAGVALAFLTTTRA